MVQQLTLSGGKTGCIVWYVITWCGIAAHLIRWEDRVGGEDVPGKRGEGVETVGKEREGERVPEISK